MKPMILLALALSIAQAAEPTGTLTLACEGTTRMNSSDEPSSMGLVVSFTNRTVTGFRLRDFMIDYIPVAITDISGQAVVFKGSKEYGDISHTISGIIDRVNGDANWTWETGSTTRTYSLKCKPTQRMF
jgi:hypothetical protein